MNNVILSTKYPEFAEQLTARGYRVIGSETLPQLIPYEQDHADMQCLILGDTAFVLRECVELQERLSADYHVVLCKNAISGKYPDNVLLNAAVIGRDVIARCASLDENVAEYCRKNGYQLLSVKQGYAKCSCAVVSDHALITADNGIYHSIKETNNDVLRIRQGRVRLEGADYGFIGGASGLDIKGNQRILYFAGDVSRHPDCEEIRNFCTKHQTKIVSLTAGELTDIGGMIFC